MTLALLIYRRERWETDMNALVITEVVANDGRTCAYTAPEQTLAVGRINEAGQWLLQLHSGMALQCEDFEEMRLRILDSLPSGACFERRRIKRRSHTNHRRRA